MKRLKKLPTFTAERRRANRFRHLKLVQCARRVCGTQHRAIVVTSARSSYVSIPYLRIPRTSESIDVELRSSLRSRLLSDCLLTPEFIAPLARASQSMILEEVQADASPPTLQHCAHWLRTGVDKWVSVNRNERYSSSADHSLCAALPGRNTRVACVGADA